MHQPPIVYLALILCGSAVLITGMLLVSRLFAQRRMSLESHSMREIEQRLARIEQAVDATALEVERLAESNRYVAKLLSERSTVP